MGSKFSQGFTELYRLSPNAPPIIAPLWTNTQTFSNTLDYRVSNDSETLSIVSAILKQQNSMLDFQLTMAIIATVFIGEGFKVCLIYF